MLDRFSDRVNVFWQLLEDRFGNLIHLASSIVLDTDRNGSNSYSFHQWNGPFSVTGSINLGDCTGGALIILFAGCILEGVTVVFAPLVQILDLPSGKTVLHSCLIG